jgi:hypothetical protein
MHPGLSDLHNFLFLRLEELVDLLDGVIRRLLHLLGLPLALVLADVGEEVARREGVEFDLVVNGDVNVSADTREELVRMVRNAVVNAQRRGATLIRIEVSVGRGARLRISHHDDGVDPAFPEAAGSRREIEVPLR